jgi:DNA-binding GntR family transcriptional regulator
VVERPERGGEVAEAPERGGEVAEAPERGGEVTDGQGAPALQVVSAVDALTAALRRAILEGELAPGERLREQPLSDRYDVARHTLRAALRRLEAEGLVQIERNRGASVAQLQPDDLVQLFELRVALEVEAARLALERGGGTLPASVHQAAQALAAAARRRGSSWAEVGAAHDALHGAIVAASESPRIVVAYEALASELRLFVLQIRPAWDGPRMADEHLALVAGLEADGVSVLRDHIDEGLHTLV